MQIKLAKTAGFCFGVNRAVELLYDKVEAGERVWDIAKKYSSCRQTLCSLNGWNEETAAVGDGPVVIG